MERRAMSYQNVNTKPEFFCLLKTKQDTRPYKRVLNAFKETYLFDRDYLDLWWLITWISDDCFQMIMNLWYLRTDCLCHLPSPCFLFHLPFFYSTSNVDNWAELGIQFCSRNQRALRIATHMSHSQLDKFCLQVDKSIILISSIEQNYPCAVDINILNRTGVLFWRMGNCFLPESLSSAFSTTKITNRFSISGFLTPDSILLATCMSLHLCYFINSSAISCIFFNCSCNCEAAEHAYNLQTGLPVWVLPLFPVFLKKIT